MCGGGRRQLNTAGARVALTVFWVETGHVMPRTFATCFRDPAIVMTCIGFVDDPCWDPASARDRFSELTSVLRHQPPCRRSAPMVRPRIHPSILAVLLLGGCASTPAPHASNEEETFVLRGPVAMAFLSTDMPDN